MTALMSLVLALIGGLGSIGRFLLDRAVASRTARSFPFGTLTVNLSGAPLLGALTGYSPGRDVALLAGVGFIGAYTTFSTWMLETQRLAEERSIRAAGLNATISLALGVTLAMIGYWIGEQI